MYYACLEFKPEKHGKDGSTRIVKKAFESRQEARDYISANYDPNLHTRCWTE